MKKIVLLLALILFSGCSSDINKSLENNIENVKDFDKVKEIDKQHAQMIEHEVKKLSEVSTCQAVVTNHIAYVGINLSKGTDESNISNIKLKVEEVVKKVCDGIEVVAVNASTELFEDSNDIDNDDNLNETESYNEQLDPMYKRVIPTV